MPQKTNGSFKKIAFVCSGGATKAAAFHLGVCLALQETGFSFQGGTMDMPTQPKSPLNIDTYVGSSSGSCISAYLAAGYSVNDIFTAYTQRKKENRPFEPISYSTLLSRKKPTHEAERSGVKNKIIGIADYALNLLNNGKLITSPGFCTTAGIDLHIKEVLPSNNFADYNADLFVVATQLNHPKRIIFCKKKYPTPEDDLGCIYDTSVSISDAVAGSAAFPPIFAPYGIRNKSNDVIYYFDGEIRETLSVNVAETAGADLIISSYTHQPYHYSEEIGSLTKFGIPAIGIQAIYLSIERKIQTSIQTRHRKKVALETVNQYCKDNDIEDKHRKKITGIMEEKLAIHSKTKYIYIHPRPKDYQMFFGKHFSLNVKFMEKIVRIGFFSAKSTLRKEGFCS